MFINRINSEEFVIKNCHDFIFNNLQCTQNKNQLAYGIQEFGQGLVKSKYSPSPSSGRLLLNLVNFRA